MYDKLRRQTNKKGKLDQITAISVQLINIIINVMWEKHNYKSF